MRSDNQPIGKCSEALFDFLTITPLRIGKAEVVSSILTGSTIFTQDCQGQSEHENRASDSAPGTNRPSNDSCCCWLSATGGKFMIKLITPLVALGIVASPAVAQTTNTAQSNTAQSNSTEQTTKVTTKTKTTHVRATHHKPVRHHRRVRRVHHHVVKKTVVTKTTTHS